MDCTVHASPPALPPPPPQLAYAVAFFAIPCGRALWGYFENKRITERNARRRTRAVEAMTAAVAAAESGKAQMADRHKALHIITL